MRHRGLFLAVGLAVTALGALPARADVVVTVDKSTQEMSVAVDGAVRWTWRVSTGRRGHDTPNGTFRALSMDANHFSKEWDNAPMPHSIFFTDLGHAIHGSFATSRMGTPDSHGCVRLEPKNATQLFALISKEGMRSTTIVVTGDAAVARARTPAARTAGPGAAPAVTTGAAPAAQPLQVPSYSLDRAARPDPQPVVRQALATQIAEPPAAPAGYPPFPRPAGVR